MSIYISTDTQLGIVSGDYIFTVPGELVFSVDLPTYPVSALNGPNNGSDHFLQFVLYSTIDPANGFWGGTADWFAAGAPPVTTSHLPDPNPLLVGIGDELNVTEEGPIQVYGATFGIPRPNLEFIPDTTTITPLPATLPLFLAGLLILMACRCRLAQSLGKYIGQLRTRSIAYLH